MPHGAARRVGPLGFTSLRVILAVTLIGARGHPPPCGLDVRVGSIPHRPYRTCINTWGGPLARLDYTTIEIIQLYTTGSVGSLGMAIDEERGQLRNVM